MAEHLRRFHASGGDIFGQKKHQTAGFFWPEISRGSGGSAPMAQARERC